MPRSVIGPGLQPNIRSIFGVNFDTLGMMLRLEFAIIYVENVLFQLAKKHESLPGYNFVFIRIDKGGGTGKRMLSIRFLNVYMSFVTILRQINH